MYSEVMYAGMCGVYIPQNYVSQSIGLHIYIYMLQSTVEGVELDVGLSSAGADFVSVATKR